METQTETLFNANHTLTSCQTTALELLEGTENVFLTGEAGTGKSYLLNQYLKDKDPKEFPIVASTGAAAILIGGRTFHSFFGLGILEGGIEETIARALKRKKLIQRLRKVDTIIIDEVSMIRGLEMTAAEDIARRARGNEFPWGGMRVICVGDFFQLPPVSQHGHDPEYCFESEVWRRSEFRKVDLITMVRTEDPEYLGVLNDVRFGRMNERVQDFLNEHMYEGDEQFVGTVLFGRKAPVERYSLKRLAELETELIEIDSDYQGDSKSVERLKRTAPIPETLKLKVGALVMIRRNDPDLRYVNGSLAHVTELKKRRLHLRLLNGDDVTLAKEPFSALDADLNVVATATNFPVNLAYASTIHKAQGATLDRILVDLSNLWESGQAYVALSRVKDPRGIFITRWSPRSFKVDPRVVAFASH